MIDAVEQARCIADTAWGELQRSLYVQARTGATLETLPDLSFSEAQRRTKAGLSLLRSLAVLDCSALPHDLALTLRLVRFRAHTWSREADWYWLVVDPTGMGAFGVFLPTAYCGAFLLDTIHGQLAAIRFGSSADTDRYLALISQYERLIDQFTERTAGQAARQIYIPRPQIEQARTLLNRFKETARTTLGVVPQRLAAVSGDTFAREVDARIVSRVGAAFERSLQLLSDDYVNKAPDRVGLGQYPGGAEVYGELVKLYTTLDLTPEEVQERGLERMREIESAMIRIRSELDFQGDAASFLHHLGRQAQWRADTAQGVSAVFQRHVDRIKPHLPEYFPQLPRAGYCAAPLPDVLQGSMTFGYYDAPRRDRPEGRYLFNTANLTQQALINVGSLTYHELMPGHHLHLATQQENENLHPFRAYCLVTAYVEGWAEYAATFAGEIGMYELPEERYGRLVMDAFLTTRLVVDPGMNVMGWSLEEARDYMRIHSGMREAEIRTESIRYSCDYVGQALAYKLGDAHILALRDRMRMALGDRFDLKAFHGSVLRPGALPLNDLTWHMDVETKRLSHSAPQTNG